jgi:hypothetical protein
MESVKPPKLTKGFFSVLQADSKTGHVLKTSGDLYLGQGDVFKIFKSLIEAKDYCTETLALNNSIEYVIYDYTGIGLLYLTDNKIEELK